MKAGRLALAVVALMMIVFSWVQVLSARTGLSIRSFERDGVPMLYIAPQTTARVPGVLIAHGFAGSKQLMLGYAYTLAHAGYATLTWDFDGHAANPRPLERDALQANIAAAAAVLISQPEVDASRLALVGHSMGSGAVMTAGINDGDRYAAVVAISPTGAEVTPAAPHNLLLQAGSLEGGFVGNATRLLATAGGASDDFSGGRARRLIVIPNAEHITILFRGESHRAALDWLGQTFGAATTTVYVDRRIIWYGLHLLGWLLALLSAAPVLRSTLPAENEATPRRRWLGLLTGAVAGVAVLGLGSQLLPLNAFLGLQVGGFVALWLFVAGLVWLILNRPVRPPAPVGLVSGVLLFAFLTVAFGVMAQGVWLQWWLNAPRLARWPILALLSLPWFLAAGYAQWGVPAWQRAVWWLGMSVIVVAAMLVLLNLAPAVGFLLLLIPTFPVILAILAVAGAVFDRPWPFALGSALFFGWVLAAIFPLA